MKILKILPALNHGGVERGVVDFAIAATQMGHEVCVTSSGGELVRELDQHGIPHIEGPWEYKNPLDWRSRAKQLGRLIAQGHFDIVHAHSRIPCWLAHLSRRYHDVPVVTGCHAAHSMGPMNIKGAYNKAVTKGDQVIAASYTIGAYLKQHFPSIEAKTHVVLRGSRIPIPADPQAVAALRAQWKLDDRPVILFPARITPGKGQMLLLQALTYLPSHLNLQIVFVGKCDNASYLHAIQKQIKTLENPHHIQFLGNCRDMTTAYQLADVVINSSTRTEAFGRIPVEAGLCRRCTIAPKQGGFCETIIDKETGFLFENNNAMALANAIHDFFAMDQQAREAMQTRCHERMLQHFTLEHMTKKVLAVYGGCL